MTARGTRAVLKEGLSADEREELLRAGWYDHDAR